MAFLQAEQHAFSAELFCYACSLKGLVFLNAHPKLHPFLPANKVSVAKGIVWGTCLKATVPSPSWQVPLTAQLLPLSPGMASEWCLRGNGFAILIPENMKYSSVNTRPEPCSKTSEFSTVK